MKRKGEFFWRGDLLKVISQACPRCWAKPMERCTTSKGTAFHVERWRAAGVKRQGKWS